MLPLNLAAIDKEARQLRTAELQRLQGLFFAKVSAYGHWMAGAAHSGLTAIGTSLRHLFSWNPQAH
ncbi:MAG: hypothetical protein HYY97_04775 [Rhodocyclales bacterium]|nr:hypothetical protein [Rhodocyclales bacterium]